MKPKVLIFVTLSTLLGCTSTYEHYKPASRDGYIQKIGPSCYGSFYLYKRDLDDGALVEVGGPGYAITTTKFDLNIRFRLEKGHSIKFLDDMVKIEHVERNEVIYWKIKTITTGIVGKVDGIELDIPVVEYKPSDRFTSQGRYSNIKTGRGVWSNEVDSKDIFKVNFYYSQNYELVKKSPESFKVTIPAFMFNETQIGLEPITFKYTRDWYLMCLQ